jgi:hypothetical protein
MNNTNNSSARDSFQVAKNIFYKAWLPSFMTDGQPNPAERCRLYVDDRKLSQHEIRLEVNLVTTATNFVFGLTPNQQNTTGVTFITENRLNLQDTMIANEYGIYIGQTTGNNDTTWQLRTYPNTQDFAAADAAALRSTFYSHGAFRITCNNDIIMPYRGLWNHLYNPQTQQTNPLGAGSPGDQVRGAEDGMVTMEPNILLVGSKGYLPEIVLKSALASAAANLRAVLIFRGVLAQNSTSVS